MEAAGDSISNAEEENEDESKMATTLGRKSQIDSILSLSPPASNTWSLVSIKDKKNHGVGEEDSSFLIFPPINHENLHLSPPSPPSLNFTRRGKSMTLSSFSSSSSSSSSSSEIVDDDESIENSSTSTFFSPSTGPDYPQLQREQKAVGVARWVNLEAEVVYSRIKQVFLYRSHLIPVKASTFATAAMVVGFLYFWWRRRQWRIEQEAKDRFVGIIREKDEVCSSTTSVC